MNTLPSGADARIVPVAEWHRHGRILDPARPGWVWSSEGGALVYARVSEMPRIERSPYDDHSFGVIGPIPASAQRFRATLTGCTVPITLKRLDAVADRDLMALTGRGLRVGRDGAWRTVPNPKYRALDASNASAFAAGPGDTLFVSVDAKLHRIDPATLALTPTTLEVPSSHNAAGLFYSDQQSNVVHFQALDRNGAPVGPQERIAPPGPMELRGAFGDALWYEQIVRNPTPGGFDSGSRNGRLMPPKRILLGYDLRRRRWSEPLELWRFGATLRLQLLDGRLYGIGMVPDSAVVRYDPESGRWESVVPALPEPLYAPMRLLVCNKTEALLTDGRELRRYDWRREAWSREPLPVAPFEVTQVSVASRPDGVYLGGANGLWRYFPATRRWTEVREVLRGDASERVDTFPQVADARGVWGEVVAPGNPSPRFVFRFDRATHRFQIHQPPTECSGGRFVGSNGEKAIFRVGDRTWWVDAQTGRWSWAGAALR